MALTAAMKEQISKDAGVKDAFKAGDTKAAKILADLGLLGLSFLPAGAAIRGGTLVYKGLKGAKAAAELRKLKAVQAAIKAQKPAPGSSTTISAAKPKVRVPAATAKKPPKPADKPKPKPQAPGLAKNRKPVASTPPKPAPKAKPKPKPQAKKKLKPADKALAAAATMGLVSAAVEKSRRGGAAKAMPTPTPKPKKPRRTPDAKKISPKGRPGATTPDTKKISPSGRPTVKKSTPKVNKSAAASKRMPKRTNISAGKNTGFGPKGNIFPKDAEDRKRLMKLYGGTGSAAAKAAAAGTQGTLKRGKK